MNIQVLRLSSRRKLKLKRISLDAGLIVNLLRCCVKKTLRGVTESGIKTKREREGWKGGGRDLVQQSGRHKTHITAKRQQYDSYGSNQTQNEKNQG